MFPIRSGAPHECENCVILTVQGCPGQLLSSPDACHLHANVQPAAPVSVQKKGCNLTEAALPLETDPASEVPPQKFSEGPPPRPGHSTVDKSCPITHQPPPSEHPGVGEYPALLVRRCDHPPPDGALITIHPPQSGRHRKQEKSAHTLGSLGRGVCAGLGPDPSVPSKQDFFL